MTLMHVKSRPPFILLLASCVELALTMQLDIGAYDHNVHTASGERERAWHARDYEKSKPLIDYWA
jgi:hypothetical protein